MLAAHWVRSLFSFGRQHRMSNAATVLAAGVLLVSGHPAQAGGLLKELADFVRGPQEAQQPAAPSLAAILEAAGWNPTPELSGAFQVGDIFDASHRWQASGCFDADVRTSTYTETEMITQFQAGVQTEGLAKLIAVAGATAGITKQVKFGTPSHIALPGLGLTLSETCRSSLESLVQQGQDLSGWYVVKEILSAQITEQTCGRVDASGHFRPLGDADAALALSCSQVSLEPVSAAFRTLPLHALLESVPEPPRPDPASTVSSEGVPESGGAEPENLSARERETVRALSTLWMLSNDDLLQLKPGSDKPEMVVTSSTIDVSGRLGTGDAAFTEDGASLYTWGPEGLAWVNLATKRAERLTPTGLSVYRSIVVDDEVVVFQGFGTGRRSIRAWSASLGKAVALHSDEDPAVGVWGVHGAGVVVLQHAGQLRILQSSDLATAVRKGEPPEGTIVDGLPELQSRTLALALEPEGDTGILALSDEDPTEREELRGPVRYVRIDLRTGKTRRVGIDKDPGRSLVYGGEWVPNVGPAFHLGGCSECDDLGESFVFHDGALEPFTDATRWPTGSAMPPLDVRMLQGQPELFVADGDTPRQVTDLRSERPDRLGPYGASCSKEPALAWRPWPSGEHVLVAAIHGHCLDETSGPLSVVQTFLVSLAEDEIHQVPIKVDLGGPWPTVRAESGAFGPRPARPLADNSDLIRWSRLGEWSPEGSRLVTPSGVVLTAEGTEIRLGARPDWWVWRPATR